jgi:hypothetical protein
MTTTFTDGFNAFPLGVPLTDGQIVGNWKSVYNGFGINERVNDATVPMLSLSPQVATAPGLTHAGLVTSVPTFGNTTLTVKSKTISQLRTGSAPNAWECAWTLWHYTDSTHFYYLALKPTGWELGKEDPAYPGAQRFLATGSTPKYPVGPGPLFLNSVTITQTGNSITAAVNGTTLATFVDQERPYLTGSIGLYCEDSHVEFGVLTATGKV